MKRITLIVCVAVITISCKKSVTTAPPPPEPAGPFNLIHTRLNGALSSFPAYNVNRTPALHFSFSAPVKRTTATAAISFLDVNGSSQPFQISYSNGDSVFIIQPSSPLQFLSKYTVSVSSALRSTSDIQLATAVNHSLLTAMDSSDKFPQITDTALIELVQRETFKYFWDFAHPVSGLARERNTSGETVTSGGSGFGIMAIVNGVHRSFISRAEGLARLQKIVSFLKNTAQHFKGAYPHWLNGTTGVVVPFSTKDNGADLVETSYLIQGLLTARQYFNGGDAAETTLRNDINFIWHRVEWDWFRKGGENVLYWHWSPNYGFEMNHKIAGWNECLITYVLAASSPTHPIPKIVYDNGWARNGAMVNNNTYYGIQLPLGPAYGGPLFFAHYSFLGIDPRNLTDAYANYWTQNRNHTLINFNHAKQNPRGHYGYSEFVWGLTASDIPNGYTASSPTNDIGVIAPTAALSSMPYTPAESMQALRFFYYKLGDRIWKQYGFTDAFSMKDAWFASSFLAIDQGPIIIMLENYRTGLHWNLFMSNPEVKTGMRNLGFVSPHL